MNSDDSSNRLPSPLIPTDTELYHALKRGESLALGSLYDRYGKLIYSLALHILKNPQEAEDLTQEIFAALWSKDLYNPSRGSLGSFLTVMTRSRAIDKIRPRGTFQKFFGRISRTMVNETYLNTPFEMASLEERSGVVQNALVQLPENQRQVLEMLYFEGLSQSEIARRLNLPLGTVKTRSRLGLLKLRQILGDFLG